VHLRWDGAQFHASSTDGIRAVVSSWSPDDRPDKDVQEELGIGLGGDDEPWEFILASEDAAHLLSTAKPIKHLEYVPLFVDCDGLNLTVRRAKQLRCPGFSVAYDGKTHGFPDLRETVVAAMGKAEATKEIWFNASLMADFSKARQRGGPAKFTFAGPDAATVVEIGERFVGVIQPVRISEPDGGSGRG
jgi:hypothetical protein